VPRGKGEYRIVDPLYEGWLSTTLSPNPRIKIEEDFPSPLDIALIDFPWAKKSFCSPDLSERSLSFYAKSRGRSERRSASKPAQLTALNNFLKVLNPQDRSKRDSYFHPSIQGFSAKNLYRNALFTHDLEVAGAKCIPLGIEGSILIFK
jgi:hypothetical protein